MGAQMRQKPPVLRLAMTGVMAALIAVLTMFPQLPNMAGGYVHLGDGLILLGVMLLGPWSVAAAGIGSMVADLIAYPPYALATLIIKGLMALTAVAIYREGNRKTMLPAFILAECVMVAGYFVFELFLLGAGGAVADLPGNMMQGAAGAAVGYALSSLVPRLKRTLR